MTTMFTKRVKRDFLDTCAGIQHGSLRLVTPEGDVHDFGTGLPEAELELHDWAVVTATMARGDIGLGETYVAGLWESPSIESLTILALRNFDHLRNYVFAGFWAGLKFRLINGVLRANSKRGSARNIRAHYDVGNEFYQLWLDEEMSYSSALFAPGDTDLVRAQRRKYDRILGRLTEAEQVLEIGCGWGAFAERAANEGRRVTGLTISPSQKGYADARLDGRAEILLQDYRTAQGRFDNIVSIEMIEAVGEAYWPTYFTTLRDRLKPGGRALLQVITVPDDYFPTYRRSSDFIRHYTFPGGMLLSNSIISNQAQRAGLKVQDSFAFGQDYAQTCRMWGQRMAVQHGRIRKIGYSEAFMRGWRYYLAACAASFAEGHTDVVQIELTHA